MANPLTEWKSSRTREACGFLFKACCASVLPIVLLAGIAGCPTGSPTPSGPPDDHGNAPGSGTPLTVNAASIPGSIETEGDVDFFSFVAQVGYAYVIETSGPMDSFIDFIGTGGSTVIASDDDSGAGFSSRIEWTCTNNGTYYVRVRHFSPSGLGTYSICVTAALAVPPDLRVFSLTNPADSLGMAAFHADGERVCVYATKDGFGSIIYAFGGSYQSADGESMSIWFNAFGLPSMAVTDGCTVWLRNYDVINGKVDIVIALDDGTVWQFLDVALDAGQLAQLTTLGIAGAIGAPPPKGYELARLTAGKSTGSDVLKGIGLGISVVACGVGVATAPSGITVPVAAKACGGTAVAVLAAITESDLLGTGSLTVEMAQCATYDASGCVGMGLDLAAGVMDEHEQAREQAGHSPPASLSLASVPVDPAPGEDVTVVVTTSPPTNNTTLTYQVDGSDGYTASGTLTTAGAGQASFVIPGGGADVRDEVIVCWPDQSLEARIEYAFK